MLDIQRHRAFTLRSEVSFTRRILLAHLLAGILAMGLLAVQGGWIWMIGALLWYALTLVSLTGMRAARGGSRHILGLLFLAFSVAGAYVLTRVEPGLTTKFDFLCRFLLGALNLLYAIAGLCLMLHSKVRKAATVGFSLW